MWPSVQCGPDPLKASLYAIQQQQALAEQNRSTVPAAGHPTFLSTASSRPLTHSHNQSLLPFQPNQQRVAASSWTDEYVRSQPPLHAAARPVPLHAAPASSWLTEYTALHSKAPPVHAVAAISPLSVVEYQRTQHRQQSATHSLSPAALPSLVTPGHQHSAQPHLSALHQQSTVPYVPAALHRPIVPTASIAPFSLHAAILHAHHLPVVAAPARSPPVSAPSTVPATSSPSTRAVCSTQPSTPTATFQSPLQASSAAEAEDRAREAARAHEALYGDEHELSDADFIHDGQWQHFTTPQPPLDEHHSTPSTVGVSAHILQLMSQAQPPPQQRYVAEDGGTGGKGGKDDRKETAAGVDVGLLEYGSEWDAGGRVWDWVVRERRRDEEKAGTGGVDEMDLLMKQYYM